MKRSYAIHSAKEAHRLHQTRGIICPGLSSYPEGYSVKLPGWTIMLTNAGKLIKAQAHGAAR